MSTHTQTPQQLRDEIDATLGELGATLEELAAKTAIKARLHDRVEHVKDDLEYTREEIADRRRRIARHAGYALVDGLTDTIQATKARVDRHPALSAISLAVVLLTGWTVLRRRG